MNESRGESRRTTWKLFGLLMLGALIGAVAILPYALELNPGAVSLVPAPLWIILLASVVQTMILTAAVSGLGLWLAPRAGLGAPRLRAWIEGKEGSGERLREVILPALLLGAASAVVIALLDIFIFSSRLAATGGPALPSPAAWKGFLASFYGGIIEELLLRLGMMTAIVWVGAWLTRQSPPGAAVVWAGNVLAALLFGAGHLPATAQLLPLTPLVVTRALLLNGIPGLLFGWLYWRRGLFAAMVSHFGADLVLHVLLPLIPFA